MLWGRRGEMGRCAVVTEQEDGWLCGTGSLILHLPRCLYPKYLSMLIGSPYMREYLGGFTVGATMQNLNQSILLKMIIGLPPLAEQHRIVAKVDELMAVCDRLEASLVAGEETRGRLVEAVLGEALAPGFALDDSLIPPQLKRRQTFGRLDYDRSNHFKDQEPSSILRHHCLCFYFRRHCLCFNVDRSNMDLCRKKAHQCNKHNKRRREPFYSIEYKVQTKRRSILRAIEYAHIRCHREREDIRGRGTGAKARIL